MIINEHELIQPNNQFCKFCGAAAFTGEILNKCTGVLDERYLKGMPKEVIEAVREVNNEH